MVISEQVCHYVLTLSTLLLARLLRSKAMDMTVAFLCASLQ